MTLNYAIEILLRCADRECVGAGCGLRALPSARERWLLYDAMERAGRRRFGESYEPPKPEPGLRRPDFRAGEL